MSNEAAAELGRLRWKGVLAEERSDHARMMNEAKRAGMTKKQRSEAARKAARARWGPPKKGGKVKS